MGQIHRTHHGQLTAPAQLLTDLEHYLVPGDGPDADTVASLFARAEQARAAGQDPEFDEALVSEARELDGHWALTLFGLHSLQRLHATAVVDGDLATLDAHWVSQLRNNLDTTIQGWDAGCQEFLDELIMQGLDQDPMTATVRKAIDASTACGQCERCQFIDLFDRLDQALDDAGFDGGFYYRHYVRGESAVA